MMTVMMMIDGDDDDDDANGRKRRRRLRDPCGSQQAAADRDVVAERYCRGHLVRHRSPEIVQGLDVVLVFGDQVRLAFFELVEGLVEFGLVQRVVHVELIVVGRGLGVEAHVTVGLVHLVYLFFVLVVGRRVGRVDVQLRYRAGQRWQAHIVVQGGRVSHDLQ